MIGRLVALGAAAVAGVAATAAALRSRRKSDESTAATRTSGKAAIPPTAPVSTKAAEVASGGEDLTTLKGVGAVSAERLGEIGVTTLAQIAAWSDEDIEDIGARIKVSPERIRREDWVGQARHATGT